MANKKIKNWHLDDSLRLQIESGSGGGAGSSAALEAALAQYVKKTDKITRTQLADSVFDNVNISIGNLRNELGQYRAIATPIGRSDLSSALQTELDTLALTASSLPADFDTRVEAAITSKIGSQEFEDQIVNLVITEYDSSITTLQSSVGTLQTNLGTLQNNVSAIQLNVGTLQTTVSNLDTTVGNAANGLVKTVSDNTSSISTINSTLTNIDSSITSLTTRVGTLESQNTSITASLVDLNTALDSCRLRSEKIEETDLSTALQTKIAAYDTNIPLLSSDIGNLESRLNNVVTASFAVLTTNVAKTQSELNTLKTNLTPSIFYLPSMMVYAIDQKDWNEYASTMENEVSEVSYANHTLSINNIDTGAITPTINDGIITINNNTSDFASLLLGIYGKNIKLNIVVPTGTNILPLSVIIDKQLFPFDLIKKSSETIQSIYIENLSHGAHRIEIKIAPNTEFKISSTIGITDNNNSGLLIASDIPAESTYDSIMYNNVNYFDLSSMNGTYTFTEPTTFDTININSYVLKTCDTESINGKIIYSQFDQKAYIINNRKMISFVI